MALLNLDFRLTPGGGEGDQTGPWSKPGSDRRGKRSSSKTYELRKEALKREETKGDDAKGAREKGGKANRKATEPSRRTDVPQEYARRTMWRQPTAYPAVQQYNDGVSRKSGQRSGTETISKKFNDKPPSISWKHRKAHLTPVSFHLYRPKG